MQVEAGSVLTSDPFSFTAYGESWRTQSWLAELVYARLEQWFGLGFVWPMVAIVAILVLTALGLVVAKWPVASSWLGVYLIVSTITLSPFLGPRPALFSFLLIALTVLAAKGSRTLWCLPLLLWIWAAAHGSWIVGGGYLVLKAIAERDRRLATALIPTAGSVLLTAHGWGVGDIVWQFAQNREALSLITEWAPTNLSTVATVPLLFALILLLLPARQGLVDSKAFWMLIPFGYLAVSSTRMMPIAWIVLAPIFGSVLAFRRDPVLLSTGRREASGINVALGVAMVVVPFVVMAPTGLDSIRFPIEAAEKLKSDRVFHDDVTGGYLVYRYGPERRVFIDDRAELYGNRIEDFILARNAGGDWERSFEQYEIREVLLRTTEPLVEILVSKGWEESYRDDNFVVVIRLQ